MKLSEKHNFDSTNCLFQQCSIMSEIVDLPGAFYKNILHPWKLSSTAICLVCSM